MEIAIGDQIILVDETDWTIFRECHLTPNVIWRGKVCEATWRIQRRSHTSYAVCTVGSSYELRMHRLILQANAGQYVDHVNGNGLDNRRDNLRLTDASGNARNRMKPIPTASRYKGVGRASPNRWAAWIRIDGVKMHLGCYASEIEAAIAYNAAAAKAFGEFARLNQI